MRICEMLKDCFIFIFIFRAHAFFGKRSRKKRHSVALGESSSKECASDTEHTGYTSIDYSTKGYIFIANFFCVLLSFFCF